MPRLVDRDRRRAEIAQAVWGVIAERGIEGVTLRAVAAEAGVSMGRIQHYHATREELVRDSCRVMLDHASGRYAELDADPVVRLEALVLGRIPATDGFALGTAVWLAYAAKAVDDPELAAMVAGAQRGAVDELAALVAEIDPGADAGAVALRLMGLAEGLAVRVLVGSVSAEDARHALAAELP